MLKLQVSPYYVLLFIGCGEGDRQDEAGRGDAGADAAGGPAHEARPAPTRGKRSSTGFG